MKPEIVYVDNREFLALANAETESLDARFLKYERPQYSESPKQEKRMFRMILGMACDAYADPSVVGILADMLEDWDYPELAYRVREDVSWIGRVKLLTLAGSSARAYYAFLVRTIGKLSSGLSMDRSYQGTVIGYPPGTDLGIPPEVELPGYPSYYDTRKVAVPNPSMVGPYQTTYPHVRRLLLAGLSGQVVSDDVGQVVSVLQEILHQELTLDRRIPWVSRLKTVGVA